MRISLSWDDTSLDDLSPAEAEAYVRDQIAGQVLCARLGALEVDVSARQPDELERMNSRLRAEMDKMELEMQREEDDLDAQLMALVA